MNVPQEVNVAQEDLDQWRAFAEQVRTDAFTVRQLIARGQTDAATELLGAVIQSAIICGLGMEQFGANRPSTLPSKPQG